MAAKEQIDIVIKAKDDATRVFERLGGETLYKIRKELDEINKKNAYLSQSNNLIARSFRDIESSVKSAFVAYAGYQGLVSAGQFVKDVIDAGIKEERQWQRVGAAVRAARFEYDQAIPVIQRITDALEMKYIIDDEAITQAWNRLLPVIKNINEGYRILDTAINLSAFAQVDLNTATLALIGAHEGQFMQLQRLTKIAFPDAVKQGGEFAKVLEMVDTNVKGQATANLTEYEQRVGRIAKAWEHTTEKIGQALTYITTGFMDVVLPGGTRLFPEGTTEDVSKLGTEIQKLDNVLNDVITTTASRRDIGILDDGVRESIIKDFASINGEMREFNAIAENGLRTADGLMKLTTDVSKGLEQFGPSISEANEALAEFDRTQREAMQAQREAMQAQQEAFNKVSSIARQALDPLHDWIVAGQSIEETFAQMGQRVKSIIADMIINMLSQAIAKALGFKDALSGIGSGYSGGGGGGFSFGALLAGLLPFDNRHNDSMLTREVRWMGELIARGVTQGMAAGMVPAIAQPQVAGPGGYTLHVHFNGPVYSEADVRRRILPLIEETVDNKFSRLAVKPRHLTGRRDGLSD